MTDIDKLIEQQRKASRMKIVARDYSMTTRSYDIFLSGCKANPKCQDCHNPESWSFDCGTNWIEHILPIHKDLQKFGTVIDKFFILGGEPLDQDPDEFSLFIAGLKEFGKEIWLFTRFELDEIPEVTKKQFDYIKTGRYLPELSTEDNVSYGVKLATSNQKIHKRGVDY